jgi:hypothetical protein
MSLSATATAREAQAYIEWLVSRTEQMVTGPVLWACNREVNSSTAMRKPASPYLTSLFNLGPYMRRFTRCRAYALRHSAVRATAAPGLASQ